METVGGRGRASRRRTAGGIGRQNVWESPGEFWQERAEDHGGIARSYRGVKQRAVRQAASGRPTPNRQGTGNDPTIRNDLVILSGAIE